jgi:hypothetical protein
MRQSTTFRLSEATLFILDTIALQESDNRTAIFERIVREEAARRQLAVPLTAEQRAELDADPVIQAALARLIAGEDGPYYLAGPDGLPTDELYVPSGDETPVDERRLAELWGE